MESANVKIMSRGDGVKLTDKKFDMVYEGRPDHVGVITDGMASGRPSVMILQEIGDNEAVALQITPNILEALVKIIKGVEGKV